MITKKTDRTCIRDSLALDYELFDTSNDRTHILRDAMGKGRDVKSPTSAGMDDLKRLLRLEYNGFYPENPQFLIFLFLFFLQR